MNLFDFNFQYVVDISYDTKYECENGSSCCDGDMCRCGRIYNAEITEKRIIDAILNTCHILSEEFNPIRLYLLDRLLTINKIYDPENWEIDIEEGWYGEEIRGCFIKKALAKNLNDSWLEISKLSDNDAIYYILNLEYGFVPHKYENLTWKIDTVNPNDVIITNLWHAHKAGSCEYYKDYKHFVCVCIDTPIGKEIVDGYHRIAQNMHKEEINILLGIEK